MDLKRFLKFVLVWIITITILAILFSRIRFSEVLGTIRQADTELLSLTILLSLLAHLFLSLGRYREILKILGCRLTFFETILLHMGSLPIMSIIPFKMGELTRMAYLKKEHSLSYPRGVSSILLGYLLSLFILLLFIIIGWSLYHSNLPQRIYLPLLFLILFSLIVLSIRRGIIPHFFKKFLKRLYQGEEEPRALSERWGPKRVIILFFYSLGFEGYKLLNTFLLFKALNIEIPYGAFLLFAPLTFLAAALPITFWGLGTRESAILLLFSGYATPARLLGGSLLISFVNRLLPILFGLLFMKPFLNRLLNIKVRSY